ncbi:MAG: TRAP transporter large permease subunit [Candidatus Aminicenantes bacterium]|nr:TRAP transporter large permease subunit [Candidatus Aminicenantes bacterium]
MPEWLVFLFMVAVFVLLAMAAKFPIGIALALSALAGALFAGDGPSPRHLVEGAFGYFDTILIILTATIFIKVLQDAGILDTMTSLMLRTFYRSKILLLLAAMVILIFPGMLTGSSTAAILSSGPLVAPVMMKLGLSRLKTGALVAMGGILGMIAPPVNILIMIMGAGVDMPYVGLTRPLLMLVVPLAVVIPLVIGYKDLKIINRSDLLSILPPSLGPKYRFRLAVPFLVLVFLMVAPGATAGAVPDVGIPGVFLFAALVGLACGRPVNVLKVTQKAIDESLPILAILAGVGMFIQVMTMTGARGWTVISVLSLPSFLLYLGISLSLPAFGGVSTFGSASILGIPFILALISKNALLTSSSLSAITSLGDLVPPAAISARFAAQVVGEPNFFKILRYCLVPALLQLAAGIGMLLLAPFLDKVV